MTDPRTTHPFANLEGIALAVGYFLFTGAMCPTCQVGTRVTSKRWARCKKCGGRVRRRTEAEFDEALRVGSSEPEQPQP
jgi:tRNA(Ile2) C34 agmatinyltransferase TiaS